jgi:hypothetical protein
MAVPLPQKCMSANSVTAMALVLDHAFEGAVKP